MDSTVKSINRSFVFRLSSGVSKLTSARLCTCAGVKIIGGYRELTGEEFGIYIKRVIGGGLAALDGMYFFDILSCTGERYRELLLLLLSSLTRPVCLSVCLIVTLCSRSA